MNSKLALTARDAVRKFGDEWRLGLIQDRHAYVDAFAQARSIYSYDDAFQSMPLFDEKTSPADQDALIMYLEASLPRNRPDSLPWRHIRRASYGRQDFWHMREWGLDA
jgi:hypothetical protein